MRIFQIIGMALIPASLAMFAGVALTEPSVKSKEEPSKGEVMIGEVTYTLIPGNVPKQNVPKRNVSNRQGSEDRGLSGRPRRPVLEIRSGIH